MLFIPNNIDIDELLQKHPPTSINEFERDYLIYIMHLILAIPASNKDLDKGSGYVPLNANTLQRKVKNYKEYLDYLLDSNVFNTDNWYIPALKSRGYRYVKYFTGIKLVEPSDIKFKRRIQKDEGLQGKTKYDYQHLTKWYNGNLKIDYDTAMAFITADFHRKSKNSNLVDPGKKFGSKDPRMQLISAQVNIEKIRVSNFSLSVDSKVFRFHSVLSNMRSQLRNCLSYDGCDLVSIDIKNSQPFLSSLLFNPYFWSKTKDSNSTIIRLKDINSTYLLNTSPSLIIMLFKFCNGLNNNDIDKYLRLVKSGRFYEHFAEEAKIEFNEEDFTREESKTTIFQILFTGNQFIGQEEAAPKRLFKKMFPTVYKIFAEIKKSDKKLLPVLLQRIESYLMLRVIAKRIDSDLPGIPLFTIHDSIVTTKGNETRIQEIMLEELMLKVGSRPAVSVDRWLPENLKFNDGVLFSEFKGYAA